MASRPDETSNNEALRKPLSEVYMIPDYTGLESTFLKNISHDAIIGSAKTNIQNVDFRSDIENLYKQVTNLINSKPKILPSDLGDESIDYAAQPLFWISKWIDHSDTYGFGYQLCDERIGVMFNDGTELILMSNQIDICFIDEYGKVSYMTKSDYCNRLDDKMRILSYFKRYMTETLVKAGANNVKIEFDQISNVPHLCSWIRTTCATVMHLTNGTVQFNFSDHQKIILCPHMGAITFIDNEKNFCTYSFSTIVEHGYSKDLYEKIGYAQEKLGIMLDKMF